jgi:hypothetical protein
MTLIPFLFLIPSDWPEGQDFAGVYQGACVSKRNCRECEQLTRQFAKTGERARARIQGETEAARRTVDEAKEAHVGGVSVAREALRHLSLHVEANPLADTELYANAGGYHQILPMDTLHVMGSKGIASLFRFFLTKLGNMSVVNQRLRLMPPVRNVGDGTRGLHYRSFRKGIEKMRVFTADDEFALLQQFMFIVGRCVAGYSVLRLARFRTDSSI